jgi:tetratricopeptide (TPR) repeat protein
MYLNNLGIVAEALGEYAAARSYYEQSLAIDQEVGDRWGGGICLSNLGDVARKLEEYTTARGYYEQALAIKQEIGNRRGGGITLNNLGMLALQQNQLEPALAHLQEALAIRQELDQPHFVVEDWAGLAKVAFLQRDRAQTATYLQQILAYLEENPTLAGAEAPLRAFHWTWELLVALEQPDQARHLLTLAVQVIQDFLDKHSNPAVQATYLKQPHHKALWAAWAEEQKTA